MKRNFKLYAAIWLVLCVASVIGIVKSGAVIWIVLLALLVVVAIAGAVYYMSNYMNNVDTSSDFKIKAQTSFIRLSAADAQGYMEKSQNSEIKTSCKKVYEALRYSDPMSTEALQDIEHQISMLMFSLGEAVNQENAVSVKEISTELVNLIGDRERICKALK